MNQERIQTLQAIYRDGLLSDTLPFWIPRCVDHEHGGFIMSMDRTGQIVDTDKGVWQQGRFTWLLGELFNNVLDVEDAQRQQWLELAKHGADFLDRHCFDSTDNAQKNPSRLWRCASNVEEIAPSFDFERF